MKKSVGKMFLKGFLLSFLIVAILLMSAVIGYQFTIHFWEIPQEKSIEEKTIEDKPIEEAPSKDNITEVKVEDISKNLIYCYNEETDEIDKMVLEIFHCKNKQLTYITIPMRSGLTMSDELYRKISVVQPAIPQVLQLSAMTGYFDRSSVFEYGVLMVEDLLGIDISYYTVIPKSIYDTIFIGKTLTTASDRTLPTETFTGEYVEFLKKIDTLEKLRAYIEVIYPSIQSNLTLTDKLEYLDSYLETPLGNVSFQLIQGKDSNSTYRIDIEKAAGQLKELTNK